MSSDTYNLTDHPLPYYSSHQQSAPTPSASLSALDHLTTMIINQSLHHYSNLTNITNITNTTDDDCKTISKQAANQHYRMFRIVVDIFLVGIICIVGFIGNALCIAVLRHDREKKNTTNWLLQTLAFADTLYLLSSVLLQTVTGIHKYTDWIPALNLAMPYVSAYIWAFASIAQTITVWLVMLVTVDRYIAICKPLKTQMRTLQRAKIAVALVVVTAIIYNIPRFMERKIVYDFDSCTNQTVVKTEKTALRENSIYFLVYKTILYFIFRAIGPLVTLIALNMSLINALRVVRKRHRDMTRSSKNRDNITLMLVVVVSIFIICEIPDLVLRIIVTISEFWKEFAPDIVKLRYCNAITNMLLTINSSINFLIYCLIGQKFRKILRQMCCGKVRGGGTEISEIEPLNTRTAMSNVNNDDMKNGKALSATLEQNGNVRKVKANGADVAL